VGRPLTLGMGALKNRKYSPSELHTDVRKKVTSFIYLRLSDSSIKIPLLAV
jgi:hypothetical protein